MWVNKAMSEAADSGATKGMFDPLAIGDLVSLPQEIGVALGILPEKNANLEAVILRIDSPDGMHEVAPLGMENAPLLDRRFCIPRAKILSKVGVCALDVLEPMLRTATKAMAESHYRVRHEPLKGRFSPGDRVPYAGRVFDHREVTMLVDSALDFWLTAGRFAEEFEKKLARTLGVRNSLLVNSGSSADLIAFMTLTSPALGEERIRKGDEVITVAAGFPATITPIIQFGAIPVFLDVSIPSYNIDVEALDAALSPKTKAVMVAHTLGNPFDLGAVKSFCDKHDLWLIEDNCDALGSEYFYDGSWRLTGTIGDLGTSSFYPPHHLTMGEGGAVYTNSPKLDRIAASFRDWGRDCWCQSGKDNTCGKRFSWELGTLPCGYDHKYIYSHFGYNLKATEMQAAIGVAQLEKLPEFTARRRKNWEMLRAGLAEVEERLILPEPAPNSRPSWFGFLMTLRDSTPGLRDKLVAFLERNGVQTRMLFAGNFLRQPCCEELVQTPGSHRVIGNLSNTDVIMHRTLWVGVYPGLTESMVGYIIEKIKEGLDTIG